MSSMADDDVMKVSASITLSFTNEDILASAYKDRDAAQQAFLQAMHQDYPSFKSTLAPVLSQLRHRQQHIDGPILTRNQSRQPCISLHIIAAAHATP
ncbi:hypothetical protein ABBQ38_000771 [Trebouxia sp. C0009 RCD-2024]